MSSMPARTLATADKMKLRMVTQGSTTGASSSSFPPQPFSSPVKRLPPCDRGVPAGSTSKWRASSAAGGRPPWTTVTPSLRLRFRHLTTSDITRLAAHAAVSSRCLGRLEQRATLPHERQHGRRGQQLPLRLRRGHLLRLTRREPPLHPSRALTLATPCTHSQPAARQAAQDGARAPRRVRRVGVLRSVHTRFVGRGRVAQALQRSRSGSIHRTVHPSFPPCAHRIYRTQPTTHAAYSQQHFSASPCTSPSAAGCTQGGWQALVRPHEVRVLRDARAIKHRRTLPPSCIRLRAALLTPRPSSLPQVTPSHEINLIKPGKIVVTNYCCWRRARWYCLTHVWAPAHTCIVSSYGKCKRYSTYSWRFTDKVTIDIQHPILGRR